MDVHRQANDITLPAPSRPAGESGGLSGRQVLAVIGTWLGLAAGFGILTWLFGTTASPRWVRSTEFTVAIVAEVYLAMVVALVLVCGGPRRAAAQLRFRFTSIQDLRLAVLMLLFTVLVSGLLYLALSPLAGGPGAVGVAVLRQATDMSRLPGASAATLGLIAVRVVILVGLAEELFFRGALYGWLVRWRSVTATIAITSLLFTAEHALAPLALPYALLFGIAAGLVRHRTGSTFPPFVMHALNDSAMLVAAAIVVARHLN